MKQRARTSTAPGSAQSNVLDYEPQRASVRAATRSSVGSSARGTPEADEEGLVAGFWLLRLLTDLCGSPDEVSPD